MNCEKYKAWRDEHTAYKPDTALDLKFDAINKLRKMQHLKRRK